MGFSRALGRVDYSTVLLTCSHIVGRELLSVMIGRLTIETETGTETDRDRDRGVVDEERTHGGDRSRDELQQQSHLLLQRLSTKQRAVASLTKPPSSSPSMAAKAQA